MIELPELVDPQPWWPRAARLAIAELQNLDLFAAAEHIGSTSIPGLSAQPVLDLMAAVRNLDDLSHRAGSLTTAGYRQVVTPMPDRLFYRRAEPMVTHLHVVTTTSWPTRNERLFRDHLLAHPDRAAEYGRIKQELASSVHDIDQYTRGKTDFIQHCVDVERSARDLPLEPVWED